MLRLSFGLTCVSISVLLTVYALGLLPDEQTAALNGRRNLCEVVAVECALAVQREDDSGLSTLLHSLLSRNSDIKSIGVRAADGRLISEIGDHQANWQGQEKSEVMPHEVAVPITTRNQESGQVEIVFGPVESGILGWLRGSIVFVVAAIALLTFVGVFLYLRFVLRPAGKSNVVPERVRATLNTVAEGVLVLDKQQRIALANDAFAKNVGWSSDELVGVTVSELPWIFQRGVLGGDVYPWKKTIDEKTTEIGAQLSLGGKQDGPRNFSVNSTPILTDDGDCRGVLATFDDLTPLENKNAELRQTLHKLKVSRRKIRNQAKDLVVAKSVAESANEAKSEFLANVSHEIRTPMNTIIGMTDITLEMDLSREQTECLELVKISANSLLELINELLDFSKIEAGKLSLEEAEFSLQRMMTDTMKLLAVRAHEKQLEFLCDIASDVPENLLGDETRLRQVIFNLVGNALKFTSKGEILVRVDKKEQPEDGICLHFQVCDTGIGIPEDKLRSIFDPFVQADGSTTRNYGGTGLGLAICKQLVELMGGEIWAESEPGKGSTMHFTIRCESAEKKGSGTFCAQHPTGRSRPPIQSGVPDPFSSAYSRVLVVDDHPTSLGIIRRLLADLGMKGDGTSCPEEAVSILERSESTGNPYDLVLVDAQLGDMDGFNLAQAIKECCRSEKKGSGTFCAQHPAGRSRQNVPDPFFSEPALILMLSSPDKRGDLERCREIGVNASFSKPATKINLIEAFGRCLGAAADKSTGSLASDIDKAIDIPPLRVLLVDDNAFNRRVGSMKLERKGHTVELAEGGQEALDAISRTHFDLVLMDMQMPGMDGLEATRQIRRQENGAKHRIPVIAMTAHAFEEVRRQCLEAGMDGYVAKPIQDEKLWQAIREVLPLIANRYEEDSPSSIPAEKKGSGTFCAQHPEGRSRQNVPDPVFSGNSSKETILNRVGGNVAMLRELFSTFQTDSTELRAQIQEAIDENNPSQLRIGSHTLKGMLGFFDATRGEDIARRLEVMGKDGQLDGAEMLFKELLREIDGVNATVSELCGVE